MARQSSADRLLRCDRPALSAMAPLPRAGPGSMDADTFRRCLVSDQAIQGAWKRHGHSEAFAIRLDEIDDRAYDGTSSLNRELMGVHRTRTLRELLGMTDLQLANYL
jgi:hypothetical protein